MVAGAGQRSFEGAPVFSRRRVLLRLDREPSRNGDRGRTVSRRAYARRGLPARPRAPVPCGARGCARSLWLSSRSRNRRAQDRGRWRQRGSRAHAGADDKPARRRRAAARLCWLVSPWVDLQMTGASLAEKANVDPLISKPYLEELASAYLAGADPANPLVSPLNADLAGLPPLLVQVGSAETLLDDAVRIARRAGAADVRINLEIWPDMIHAWHLWAAQLEEGRRAIASASAFIRAQLQRSSEVPKSS